MWPLMAGNFSLGTQPTDLSQEKAHEITINTQSYKRETGLPFIVKFFKVMIISGKQQNFRTHSPSGLSGLQLLTPVCCVKAFEFVTADDANPKGTKYVDEGRKLIGGYHLLGRYLRIRRDEYKRMVQSIKLFYVLCIQGKIISRERRL
ncbi:hypothetical protein ACOME3_000135 [Neoechinorhynchus agilis]